MNLQTFLYFLCLLQVEIIQWSLSACSYLKIRVPEAEYDLLSQVTDVINQGNYDGV